MTIGRRRGAAAALLLAAAVLTSACSGDPEPEFAPPSSSPSATEPVTEPVRQPWQRKTKTGAVAFVDHWMATFSKAMNSLDSAALRNLSSPTCRTCSLFADRMDAIKRDGGFYTSPGWRMQSFSVAPASPAGEHTIALMLKLGRERFKETAQAAVQRNPTSKAEYTARTEWTERGWVMTELEPVT